MERRLRRSVCRSNVPAGRSRKPEWRTGQLTASATSRYLALHYVHEIERLRGERVLAGLDPLQVEEIVDQRGHATSAVAYAPLAAPLQRSQDSDWVGS